MPPSALTLVMALLQIAFGVGAAIFGNPDRATDHFLLAFVFFLSREHLLLEERVAKLEAQGIRLRAHRWTLWQEANQ